MADLDEKYSLKVEADAVVKEIQFAVESVSVSNKLVNTNETVYLNLRSKEGNAYCVELSVKGFRVIGNTYDTVSETNNRFYETIYSMLDTLSPGYRNTFGDALMKKLEGLQKSEEEYND